VVGNAHAVCALIVALLVVVMGMVVMDAVSVVETILRPASEVDPEDVSSGIEVSVVAVTTLP
jgi:hypothetical protein